MEHHAIFLLLVTPNLQWKYSLSNCVMITTRVTISLGADDPSNAIIKLAMSYMKCTHCTVKEEIFVGEKVRTFPLKTFRTEFNFLLAEWRKRVKARRDDRKACKPGGRKFGMEFNSYFFQIHERYEIKFPTEISSFTVHVHLVLAINHLCIKAEHLSSTPTSPLMLTSTPRSMRIRQHSSRPLTAARCSEVLPFCGTYKDISSV